MSEKQDNSVLVAGSIAYDCIETPLAKEDYILGGASCYAALACSYFAPVKMAGIAGNDFKASDMERLKARGIDVSGVEFDANKPTFFWRGKYHENFKSRETIDVRLNAFEDYSPKLSEEQASCGYVLLGNISPVLQESVLEQMKNPRFVVLDTMDLWISTANDTLRRLIGKVDLLILNDDEAKQLSGCSNLLKAGDALRDMGAKAVIIKKGEHGSMLFCDDGFFTMGTYPVRDLYDPTGAGDSYAGALIGYIASKGDASFETLKRAMLAAAATSSITVESFSCYKLEKSGMEEISRRMDYIRKISSI